MNPDSGSALYWRSIFKAAKYYCVCCQKDIGILADYSEIELSNNSMNIQGMALFRIKVFSVKFHKPG
jgi:hypothetical protein